MYLIFMYIPIFLLFFIIIVLKMRKKKANRIIEEQLIKIGSIEKGNKIYDYKLESNDCIYLIKIVYNFDCLEISVNNKNHWEYNSKVVSSKKGIKINDIYDLINTNYEFDKQYKKIYLVYPNAKTIIKAINESEHNVVIPTLNCYGVNIIKFDEINELKNL